jgi:tetratricopeptide (TPR) repeat protein/transglutaminase-like putative cysteine protease
MKWTRVGGLAASLRLLLSALFLSVLVPAAGMGGDLPWERTFFAAGGREVLAAAQAVPAQGEVVVLLDEGVFSFASDGRVTSRYRLVYRILGENGMKGWATVNAAWSPWYQERPAVRARVIAPDGTVHTLRPEAFVDSPLEENSDDMFHDRRLLRAPLPALRIGAVVEEEIVIRETSPYFAAGTLHRFSFGRGGAETLSTRLVLETPRSLPLRHVVQLLPDLVPVATETDGVRRLTFEAGAIKPLQPAEPGMPGDLPRWPSVAFTVGSSWGDIARAYGEVVDRSIAAPDLSSLVRQIAGDAPGRDVIAARLLAYVRSEIRYTGVELGESTIVPHTPAETLRLKYGDCKDQSALLVRLLRTAGLPAYVALLRSGVGEDVDPRLPGLGDFNHAIVYVPGTPPLWIDPTEPSRPLGELPLYEQGRSALIASIGTVDLTRTPEAPSSANRMEQTREFFLAESGLARVVETTNLWGSLAAGYRNEFGHGGEKEQRTALEQYATTTYRADTLGSYEFSPAKDLAPPYRMRLEIPAARRGQTDETDAVVAIFAESVLKRLPDELTEEGDKAPREPRRNDFFLREPYLAEVRYRIVPPAGYTAKPLPKNETVELGPMLFSRSFALEDTGEVTVLLRLDTRKRRLTAAEFTAAREGVRRLMAEKGTLVGFEQQGRALLAAGRIREAIGEFRRLAMLHPGEALHHLQTADALLEAGLSGPARREAEMAVALEPRSADAHRTLAWVLQHDAAGRLRRQGFERSRAIAEYRRAIELDPKDAVARGDLAILLEHDDDGERYGRTADLAGAIGEYLFVRTELKNRGLDGNLLTCLMRTERWRELKEIALTLEDRDERNAYLLVAVAAAEGVAPALEDGRRLIADPAARYKGYATAGATLIKLRRYQEAAALLGEAAKGGTNAAGLNSRSALVKKIRRIESLPLDESKPTTVVKQMLMAVVSPRTAPVPFLSLFARSVRDAMGRELQEGQANRLVEELEKQFRGKSEEISPVVAIDLALGTVEFRLDGDSRVGYRITMTSNLREEDPGTRIYVTPEGGGYRIISTNDMPDLAGWEILHRLDRGDTEGARTLLNWVRDEVRQDRGDDSLPGLPFGALWERNGTGTAELMRLAAAALLAEEDGAGMIPLLTAGREAAPPRLRPAVDVALMQANFALKRYEQVLAIADRLAPDHAGSERLLEYRLSALRRLHRWDEVYALAEERLKAHPDAPDALRLMASCLEHQGDFARAEQIYRRLVDGGSRRAIDYNNLAWLALFHTPVPTEAVSLAEQAVSLSGGEKWGGLHTLAALYAETGKTAAARETILKSMDLSGSPVPASHDWYVLGVIAEQYGETQAAREAFANMDAGDPDNREPNSTYALMERRLGRRK